MTAGGDAVTGLARVTLTRAAKETGRKGLVVMASSLLMDERVENVMALSFRLLKCKVELVVVG